MALRIKCKCGVLLKVSSKQADQRLNCPRCQRPFRIPAAKFREAIAKAAARRGAPPPQRGPVASEHPAAPQPAELDLVPAELDLVPANLDLNPAPLSLDAPVPPGLEIEPPPPEERRQDMFDELRAPQYHLNIEADNLDADVQRRKFELSIKPGKLTPADEPSSTDLSGDLEFLSSGVLEDLAAQSARTTSEAAPKPAPATLALEPLGGTPVAMPVAAPAPATVGYAGERSRQRIPTRNVAGDVIEGPKRGFWADAFSSFAYPVWSSGNAVTFAVIALLAVVQPFLAFVPCVGVVLSFIVTAWFCALYFSVIQDTASGSDDLPDVKMEGGFVDGILKPLFKFVGAFAIALAPAAVLTILGAVGLLPDVVLLLTPVWAAVGVFLLPVCLLLFAFDAPSMLLRPDLILLTILRTFLPYLAVWLMLLLVGFAYLISVSAAVLGEIGLGSLALGSTGASLVFLLFVHAAQVYVGIAAMRIIGLYYLHFKKRFAIIME